MEDGENRKITYEGGSRKCLLVKEGLGVKEVRGMVTETIGGDLLEYKVWYSLKCDRQMLMYQLRGIWMRG